MSKASETSSIIRKTMSGIRLFMLATAVLVLHANAKAAIIYNDIPDIALYVINDSVTQTVDLNGDGINDFRLTFSYSEPFNDPYYGCPGYDYCEDVVIQSGIIAEGTNLLMNREIGPYIDKGGLEYGEIIDGYTTTNDSYFNADLYLSIYDSSDSWAGYWWPGDEGYLGFIFDINGETHYGWGRFKVSASNYAVTFFDYAYESDPGVPIYAGVIPTTTPVPLPAAGYLFLAGTGLFGVLGFRRRTK